MGSNDPIKDYMQRHACGFPEALEALGRARAPVDLLEALEAWSADQMQPGGMIDRIDLGADHQPSLASRVTTRFAPAAITNFLPGTRRLRRKGPFPKPGISGRFRPKRIAISKNLIRLRVTGSRSPVA